MDAIEEITGRTDEPSPSLWDDLQINTTIGHDAPASLRPDDVQLETQLAATAEGRMLKLPAVLTDNSGGQLSPRGRLALLQAAARTGAGLRLSDPTPDITELMEELEVPLWAVLGPRRPVESVEALGGAAVVELQLVSLSTEGGIERSVDAFGSEGSLASLVELMQTVVDETPIFINVGLSTSHTLLKEAAESGADGLLLQAASRRSKLHHRLAGTSPLATTTAARKARARTKREEGTPPIKIAVSGGFKDGVEVAKALALGADLVVMGTAPRIALGCTLCGECGPGECPSRVLGGPAEPSVGKEGWRAEADRLVAYIERVQGGLRTALVQMGCTKGTEAVLEMLEARDYDTAATTGVALAGYGEPLPMWLH
jgi:hypothetical protein